MSASAVRHTTAAFDRSHTRCGDAPLLTLIVSAGGMLVGFPPKEKMKHSVMFTPAEFQYYADTFKKSGFRGGLNWYRYVHRPPLPSHFLGCA
jgi:hypothetical protein